MPEGTAPKSFAVSTGAFPASRKIHVAGERFPEIRVAMREIDLEAGSGEAPVRVYDPSGPYTDPAVTIDIQAGLKPLRRDWILGRGDVEAYDGRAVRPEDNGRAPGEAANLEAFPDAGRRPLRAKPGHNVTQLHYARKGIVTPEMEYIAIRENLGRARLAEAMERDGESFGAEIPDFVTPEFVRD
jgi:phosphomethylpyrimidine synthase